LGASKNLLNAVLRLLNAQQAQARIKLASARSHSKWFFSGLGCNDEGIEMAFTNQLKARWNNALTFMKVLCKIRVLLLIVA
jgi:hypothetical protein